MKILIIICSVLFSINSFAKDCLYSQSFKSTGWKIHDPQDFAQHAKNVKNKNIARPW